MNEFEILINSIVHVGLAISIFYHLDSKKYAPKFTKVLFIVPMFSMFIGFYYFRSYLDGEFEGKYWRAFRIFETIGNGLFWSFVIFKNYKLKNRNDEKK